MLIIFCSLARLPFRRIIFRTHTRRRKGKHDTINSNDGSWLEGDLSRNRDIALSEPYLSTLAIISPNIFGNG